MRKNIIILFAIALILFLVRENIFIQQPSQIFKIEKELEKPICCEKINPTIKIINEKNSKIRSFFCENVSVKIKQNSITSKVHGFIAYEKDLNFKLELSSLFGLELDMGSNSNLFWVWSKRMKPRSTMFFANHKDLYKTRLKDPFVPMWIMGALGFQEISCNNIEIFETKKHLIVSRKVVSPNGKKLIKKTFIDKKSFLIIGHYLYDYDGNEVIVMQISHLYDETLDKIYIRWNKENVIMSLNFKDPKINLKINSRVFGLPNYKNKINMGTD